MKAKESCKTSSPEGIGVQRTKAECYSSECREDKCQAKC